MPNLGERMPYNRLFVLNTTKAPVQKSVFFNNLIGMQRTGRRSVSGIKFGHKFANALNENAFPKADARFGQRGMVSANKQFGQALRQVGGMAGEGCRLRIHRHNSQLRICFCQQHFAPQALGRFCRFGGQAFASLTHFGGPVAGQRGMQHVLFAPHQTLALGKNPKSGIRLSGRRFKGRQSPKLQGGLQRMGILTQPNGRRSI